MQAKNDLHHTRWIAACILVVSVLCWLYGKQLAEWHIAARLPLHTALETITNVVFFAVFMVCWNAFSESRNRNTILLAVAFFCTGIFGLLHALSFQGMPGFTTALDMHRSLSFWLVSRLIAALALLALALNPVTQQVSKAQSYLALLLGILFTAMISFVILCYPEFVPDTFIAPAQITSFKLACEILIISINLLTAFTFYRQVIKAQQNAGQQHMELEKSSLFLATFVAALSEIYFASHHGLSDFNVLVGHGYQFISALLIYRGMVAVNIHTPYATLATSSAKLQEAATELAINRNRLNGIIDTAIDGVITVDENQNIVLVNPAAAQIFGATVAAMQGAHLEQFIPARHRQHHHQHVKKFGATGTTIRKMGSDLEDFTVTGMRPTGEEFPIEASISSLLENGHRFYTVIFRDITERKLSKERLAKSNAELSQLSNALQSIREEERKHIARELHDDLGQLLAALRMDLSLLQRDTEIGSKSRQVLNSMDQLILTSISTLRRIATDLRPRALDEGGLFFALQSLQKEFSTRHQIPCRLIADEQELRLDDQTSTTVFRIIQESLTNVARHAQATEVSIQLTRDAQFLEFSIRDNGRGIAAQDMGKTQSFGLVGMRERVKAMNGEIQVGSNAGNGTLLEIRLPIHACEEDNPAS